MELQVSLIKLLNDRLKVILIIFILISGLRSYCNPLGLKADSPIIISGLFSLNYQNDRLSNSLGNPKNFLFPSLSLKLNKSRFSYIATIGHFRYSLENYAGGYNLREIELSSSHYLTYKRQLDRLVSIYAGIGPYVYFREFLFDYDVDQDRKQYWFNFDISGLVGLNLQMTEKWTLSVDLIGAVYENAYWNSGWVGDLGPVSRRKIWFSRTYPIFLKLNVEYRFN